MGKVITNSQGKVLVANNKGFEVTAAIDSNIVPSNIKKDVTILGVTGTYEGSGGGGGVLPLAFRIGVNITDSTLIAKWDEMMAEAQTKGNENVSPFSYFLVSKQTGSMSWNVLSGGYIQSDYNSIRFADDWVIAKQNGELTMYYDD